MVSQSYIVRIITQGQDKDNKGKFYLDRYEYLEQSYPL